MQIADKYSKVLNIQNYDKKTPIEGVKFNQVKYYRDESSDFVELGRLLQGKLKGFSGFKVRQISCSRLLPGAVKAFHLHKEQADIWYVSPLDRMLARSFTLHSSGSRSWSSQSVESTSNHDLLY
jgi:dTDP-4-dehydrorhamnose 3,5-epimerase